MTDLLELAEICERLPHMSRTLNCDIQAVIGDQFGHGFTGHVDAAKRIVPEGYVWCCGTAVDDDGLYSWANVHEIDPGAVRVDISTRAATPELALCAAALRALATKDAK